MGMLSSKIKSTPGLGSHGLDYLFITNEPPAPDMT